MAHPALQQDADPAPVTLWARGDIGRDRHQVIAGIHTGARPRPGLARWPSTTLAPLHRLQGLAQTTPFSFETLAVREHKGDSRILD